MNITELWEKQKPALSADLQQENDAAGMVRVIRHSLNQIEQDLLAGITDDTLRQQTGLMTVSLKQDMELLCTDEEIVIHSSKGTHIPLLPLLCAGIIVAAILVMGTLRGDTLLQFLCIAIVCCCIWEGMLLLHGRRHSETPTAHTRPDPLKLIETLSHRIRLLEYSLADLEQLHSEQSNAENSSRAPSLSSVSDLLESITVLESHEKDQTARSAQQLLESMGLKALEFTPENASCFDMLPSKTTTCTLSPAILDRTNGTLLRRGTAAVMRETQNS